MGLTGENARSVVAFEYDRLVASHLSGRRNDVDPRRHLGFAVEQLVVSIGDIDQSCDRVLGV